MKHWLVLVFLLTAACQTTREKNAIILKDRVEKLNSLSAWKPLHCQVKTELSGPQAQKYEVAFADEKELLENWDVTYDWIPRRTRCEAKPKPLTAMTANQRAFVEEAFCTLLQVFWVHSPFDELKVMPQDIEDSDTQIFLRQKEDSDIGIYLSKTDMKFETRTAHKGTYSARYAQVGKQWLPSELRHETPTFKFVLRDFEWSEDALRAPPKSFWIYVGDIAAPVAHTKVIIDSCQPL
jgi:hypothetical protein